MPANSECTSRDRTSPFWPRAWKALEAAPAAAGVASACVLGVLLAVQVITSPDLGYHLAYGEQFFKTGRIVDSSPFIYALPAEGPEHRRPEPGPGCWYDRHGRYRFPNANWLSQVVMYGVYRLAGATGLSILQVVLAAGILALNVVTMRRLAVPWWAIGPGVVLVAMVAHERFGLRPEVFGFLLLSGQLCLLLPACLPGKALPWRAVAGIVALQLLLVNFHSFFFFGLVFTGALLAGQAARSGWAHLTNRADRESAGQRLCPRLAASLAGQLMVCFVNPWTWRLALLPVQTLLFLRRHEVVGTAGAGAHPWAAIAEFASPFSPHLSHLWATKALYLVLAVSAGAILAALARKRWGWMLVMLAAAAAAVKMRRNLILAGLVIVPTAWATLGAWLGGRPGRARAYRRAGAALLAALTTAFAGWCAVMVVTQRFWYAQRRPVSFGMGMSRLEMPLDAAEWINAHCTDLAAQGRRARLFCDFGPSSNLHFFTRPHREVPILTNTWAYPPQTMRRMREICGYPDKARRFYALVGKCGIEVVVLRLDGAAALATMLDQGLAWKMVHLSGRHAVFIRRAGPLGQLARQWPPPGLRAYKADLRRLHPVEPYALAAGGAAMICLGRYDAAIDLLTEASRLDPRNEKTWNSLGFALMARGAQRRRRGDPMAPDDFREARECFRRALKLRPSDPGARQLLRQVERQLQAPAAAAGRRPP